jgi:membrane protease YdiL (CAAX protease family)
MMRLSNKPWLAILTTAVVFGLLHGTFFKLLPIFTLGVVLGVVYYITRNLWYCIIIHFLNNAFAVLAVYYADRSTTLRNLANDDISVPLYGAIVSLAIGVGIIYFVKIKSDEVMPKAITDDDNDYLV